MRQLPGLGDTQQPSSSEAGKHRQPKEALVLIACCEVCEGLVLWLLLMADLT